MWGPDAPVVPPRRALNEFIFAWMVFGGIAAACWAFGPDAPMVARDYPFNGLERELGGNKVCPPAVYILDSTLSFVLGSARDRG